MRYLVSLRYTELYGGKGLDYVMDSECGDGNFGKALQFCAVSQVRAEAAMLRLFMQGVGAKEELMYPILGGRTNEEMNLLKQTYFEQYEEDLAVRMASELGGDFERFSFHCLQAMEAEFDPDFHTAEKVDEDVETFYEAGQGSWGTDEKGVFEMVAKAPKEHLEAINEAYQAKYEKTLEEVLDSELGGDLEKAVRHAVGMKLDPVNQVMILFDRACKGFGTNEMLLTSTLIRYETMLPAVNEKHVEVFGTTLPERIEAETGGDYCKLLLAILATE